MVNFFEEYMKKKNSGEFDGAIERYLETENNEIIIDKEDFILYFALEMEAQKLRYKQISEGITPETPIIPLTQEQIEVENTRKIVNDRLQEDLNSMNKKYH